MPKFVCIACGYETEKKSNIANHLKSKSHLTRHQIHLDCGENVSIISSEIDSQELKIKELEALLKIKDETIKSRDESIAFLQSQLLYAKEHQTIVINENTVSRKIIPKAKHNNIEIQFQEETDVEQPIDIEDFFIQYIKNSDNTKYTNKTMYNGISINALKPDYFKPLFPINIINAAIDIIFEKSKMLSPSRTFYKIKDKSRHIFEIRSKGSWIKSTDTDLLNKLFTKTCDFIYFSYVKIKNISNLKFGEGEQLQTAQQKKRNGLELTETDKRLIAESSLRIKQRNEFEKYTSIPFNKFEAYEAEKSVDIFLTEEKIRVGIKHFMTALATNKNPKMKEDEIKEEEEDEASDEEHEYY